MAQIDNILGQSDTIQHSSGTMFEHTFAITLSSDGSAFSLTNYTGVFTISKTKGSASLYEASTEDSDGVLSFSANSFTISDNITITDYSRLYFQLIITHNTEAERIYCPWFGAFLNE